MQECQCPGVPVRKFSLCSNGGDFTSLLSYWRWENWWSISAQGPEPVLSGSTVMTARVFSSRAGPLPLQAAGGWGASRQCRCSPQATGCRTEEGRWAGSALDLSVPVT